MEHFDNKRPVIIGLIHAKWCGHCRNLIPIWNKMRTNIDQKPYRPPPQYMVIEHSNLGELDRFNNENSLYLKNQRVQADGFPTIFKINNGNIDYYKDVREPNSLEKWFMNEQSYISSQHKPIEKIAPNKSKKYRRKRRRSIASRRRRRTIKNRKYL